MSRDRTTFGQRMYEARRAAGLDQKVVAKEIGISQSTLSELEHLAKGTSHVVAFAKLYRVSANWLATGQGQANESDAISQEAMDVARAYDRMNPSERHRLRLLMLAARDGVNPTNITSPNQAATTPPALELDSGLGDLGPAAPPSKKRS